jgi:hypothetical protein
MNPQLCGHWDKKLNSTAIHVKEAAENACVFCSIVWEAVVSFQDSITPDEKYSMFTQVSEHTESYSPG